MPIKASGVGGAAGARAGTVRIVVAWVELMDIEHGLVLRGGNVTTLVLRWGKAASATHRGFHVTCPLRLHCHLNSQMQSCVSAGEGVFLVKSPVI